MASQRAQIQLAKHLDINAPGTVQGPSSSQSHHLLNLSSQQSFPTYALGYDPLDDVEEMQQPIPARPANGQGTEHPFDMLSETNLHPILFRIEPGLDPFQGVPVPLLVDQQTGLIEHGNSGHPLRYFSHLPRWVATDVAGMVLELWIRLDSRVQMSDILDRVNVNGKMPRPNTLNMRRIRFREIINVPAMYPGRSMPTANEVQLIGNLTREQILLNTSMAVDLQGNRLLRPCLVNNKTVAGYVDSGLSIDFFIADFGLPIPIPGRRTIVTLELRKRLQQLARRRGLGNRPADYNKLSKDLLPSWWNKSVAVTPMPDLDGKSHDEFVADLLDRLAPTTTRNRVRRPGMMSSASPAGPAAPASAPVSATTIPVARSALPAPPLPSHAGAATQSTSSQLPPSTTPSALRNAAAFFPRPSQTGAMGVTTNSNFIDPRLLVSLPTRTKLTGAPLAGVGQFQVATPTGTSYYVEAATQGAAAQVARPGIDQGDRSDQGAGGLREEEERAAWILSEYIASGQFEEGAGAGHDDTEEDQGADNDNDNDNNAELEDE
ncbi:hypothetical protein ABEF95_015452 [Exophiala dermatitidis]